jgi:hypothetical protein
VPSVVVLDSEPLGRITNPKKTADNEESQRHFTDYQREPLAQYSAISVKREEQAMSKGHIRQLSGVIAGVVIGLCLGASMQSRSQAKQADAPAGEQNSPLVEIVVPKPETRIQSTMEVTGGTVVHGANGINGQTAVEANFTSVKFGNGVILRGHNAEFTFGPAGPGGETHIDVRPATWRLQKMSPRFELPTLQPRTTP